MSPSTEKSRSTQGTHFSYVAGVDEEKAGGSLEREEDEGVEGGAGLVAEIPPGSSLGERRQEKPACDQDQRGKGLSKTFLN